MIAIVKGREDQRSMEAEDSYDRESVGVGGGGEFSL